MIVVPKNAKLGQGFSKAQIAASAEHPGRRTDGTQSAASWLSDLTGLKKLIVLCSFCRVKFNPRKNGYRRFYVHDIAGATDGYAANGRCDACKQPTVNAGGGTAFIHEETYDLVCVDPIEQRRQARRRSASAWRTR